MGESPRWHDGRFWMCDWLAGEVLAFAADGDREVVARFEGLPFSIDWLPDGRLVLTTNAGRGRRARPGAVRRERAAVQRDRGRRRRPLLGGHARLDAVGGAQPGSWPSCCRTGPAEVVADDVWFPNGMAIVDEDTLVVAESHADRLTAWTITLDGSLADRRVWAELGEDEAPDGICVDAEGAIWYASVPGEQCVRVAEGGAVLDDGGGRPGLLLLHARRRRRPHALHRREPATPTEGASDGVVLTTRVDVPHAGRP